MKIEEAMKSLDGWALVWTTINCYLAHVESEKDGVLECDHAYAWVVQERPMEGRVVTVRAAYPMEMFASARRVRITAPVAMIVLSSMENADEARAILGTINGAEEIRKNTGKPSNGPPRIVLPSGPVPVPAPPRR